MTDARPASASVRESYRRSRQSSLHARQTGDEGIDRGTHLHGSRERDEVVAILDRDEPCTRNARGQFGGSLIARVLVCCPVHDQRGHMNPFHRPAIDRPVRTLLEVVTTSGAVGSSW